MLELFESLNFYAHVAIGTLGLLAGYWALSAKKGSRKHILAGRTFIGAVVVTSVTVFIFSLSNFAFPAFLHAVLTLVFGVSAVLALRQRTRQVAGWEWLCTIVAAATLPFYAQGIFLLASAGRIFWIAPAANGLVVLLLVIGDLRFYWLDTAARRQQRLGRHLSRMAYCIAIGTMAPLVSFGGDLGLNRLAVQTVPLLIWPLLVFYFWSKTHRMPAQQVPA